MNLLNLVIFSPNQLFFDKIFTEVCRHWGKFKNYCRRLVYLFTPKFSENLSNNLEICEIGAQHLEKSGYWVSGASNFDLVSDCNHTAPRSTTTAWASSSMRWSAAAPRLPRARFQFRFILPSHCAEVDGGKAPSRGTWRWASSETVRRNQPLRLPWVLRCGPLPREAISPEQ